MQQRHAGIARRWNKGAGGRGRGRNTLRNEFLRAELLLAFFDNPRFAIRSGVDRSRG